MKKILILALIVFISNSCATFKTSKTQNNLKFNSTDFISLTVPTIYEGDISYIDESLRTKKHVDVNSVKHDKTLLNSFPDIVASVTVYKINTGGSVTLLGNSVSTKNETYKVIYDFSQTQTIQEDKIKKSVGIAIRMIAEVTTEKKGLILTDIFDIGFNAEKEKLTGSLTVRSIGLSSQKVNQSIPTTTDLSPASIATALQSVATIKSSIYDSETYIIPHIIGFSVGGNTEMESVEEEINKMSL
jgi:hypothetical protein